MSGGLDARSFVLADARVATEPERGASCVVVRAGRVAEVRPRGRGDRGPEGLDVIDVEGRFLTPGLVDVHVHLSHESRAHRGVDFAYDEPDVVVVARVVQNLSELQQQGVALVRDVGGPDHPVREVATLSARGTLLLPDVESAGVPFCRPGGHGIDFGRPPVAPRDIRRVLARHRLLGHRWIKVMNGPELWPASELTDLCAAAHANDLKVAVHAFTDEGVWGAIDAGADTIEHCLITSAAMHDAVRGTGTVFVPTGFAAETSLAPSFARSMPAQEIGYLETWRRFLQDGSATHRTSGLPALVGTDAGCAPCQGQDVIDELEWLVGQGFDAMSVVRWATVDGARVLGRADYGEIAPGRWASVIVTDGDPAASVSALRDPAAIFTKGIAVRDRLELNRA